MSSRRSFLLQSGALAAGSFAAAGDAATPPGDAGMAAFGRSALDFGADPSGERDSTEALQRAMAATGAGRLLLPRGRYRVRQPLQIPGSGLSLIGESTRGGSGQGTVLFKDASFTGAALLLAQGDSDERLTGLTLAGLIIDGQGRPGSGIRVQRAGNVVMDTVIATDNAEWGVVMDGAWLCSLQGVIARRNGTADDKGARGGGILFSSESRSCSDCRISDSYSNRNFGWQMRLSGDGGKRSRITALTAWACQLELPSHADERVPILAVEASARSSFFGCNIMQEAGRHAPALLLGSAVEDVSFIACCTQYNGRLAAIKALAGVGDVSFTDLRSYGKGRIFDFASGIAPGAIHFNRPIDLARGTGGAAASFPLMTTGRAP